VAGSIFYRPVRAVRDSIASCVHPLAGYAGSAALDAFLARTDILVCLLPLTSATRGILDARVFDTLPHGAAVVNCGRGAHLVLDDLLLLNSAAPAAAQNAERRANKQYPPVPQPLYENYRLQAGPIMETLH
jgi:glyoxylate/hydroxypyruvate reductase A